MHAARKAIGFSTPTLEFPVSYATLIDQYFSDVAHDSGGAANVYSVDPQYTDGTGPAQYQSSFAGAVIVRDPLPANGCDDGVSGPGTGDPVCLTDAQLETEIQNVVTAQGWHGGLGNMFFLFTPSGVGSCGDSTPAYLNGECSTNFFCAYHSYFVDSSSEDLIYANEPFEFDGCNDQPDGQGFPNDPNADTTISTVSHEHSEAITDPLTDPSNYGWINTDDQTEIGDLCAYTYGASSGSAGNGQPYNQVINGHEYSLQQEWSNGDGGCVQRLGGTPTASPSGDVSLADQGGPVMHTNTTYAIYWLPTAGILGDPIVAGTVALGHTLTSSAGIWNGSPSAYAYQWQRCSSTGTNCLNIAGATGPTYTVASADGGSTLRSTVSAQNVNGSSPYVASATTQVVSAPPVSLNAPVLSGMAGVGKTLSVTTGTWNMPSTYAYHWLRCNSTGHACAGIARATESTYVPTKSDVGHRLKAQVSATNSAGTTPALSNLTAEVLARPASSHGPRISGKAKSGRTLRASVGTWSGTPTFAYQWLRCNAKGAHCVSIHGAKRTSYRATTHDVGHRLRIRVTARNRGGRTAATSAATAKVHA